MTELLTPLSLPPAPVELCKAETDLAAADDALKLAAQSLQTTRSRIIFSGQRIATPEEITTAEAKVDEARAAFESVRVTRDRLRREYAVEAQEVLAPAIAALSEDIRDSFEHLNARLTAATSLHRQARAAGINLDDRLLSASERLQGLLVYFRTVLATVERR